MCKNGNAPRTDDSHATPVNIILIKKEAYSTVQPKVHTHQYYDLLKKQRDEKGALIVFFINVLYILLSIGL